MSKSERELRDQKIKEHQSEYEKYRRQTKKRKGGRGRQAGRAKLAPVERTSEMMAREMQIEINPKVEHIPVAAPIPIPQQRPMVWAKTPMPKQQQQHTCNRCGLPLEKGRPPQTRFHKLCLRKHTLDNKRTKYRIRRQAYGAYRMTDISTNRKAYQQEYRQIHKASRRITYQNTSDYGRVLWREHSRIFNRRNTDRRRWELIFTGNRNKIRNTNDISQCRFWKL